ncbi:MAG: glycoside hydrolase family 1 protein [Candidatus Poribacteria bacterium]|nr:glycoside hydrolase family 1 protein [Candidatus Poribacteria bacterium]
MNNEAAPAQAIPDDLLLGSATSATQIEGGELPHSWARWSEQGKTADGSHPKDACMHWERALEDAALISRLNCQTYRLSIEWARLQPTQDAWDAAALDQYRQLIGALRDAGVLPLVTLHHFTNPLWIEDAGGWTNRSAVEAFETYAERVVSALGDLVSEWITVNEPAVYAYHGHLQTIWPPGKRRLRACRAAVRNMLRAHIRAYRLIHEIRGRNAWQDETRVGAAKHFCAMRPARPEKRLDRLGAKIAEHLFQDAPLFALSTGAFLFPYGYPWLRHDSNPEGSGDFSDFTGVNYYQPYRVRWRRKGFQRHTPDEAPTNDLGWEIDAEGLRQVCADAYEAAGKPIYITENGVADADDAIRSRFIYEHLAQTLQARQDGIPIQRYYHWTLMDNFEWAEGMSAKFGLAAVDPQTYERIVKPSGEYYAQICKTRRLIPVE